MTPEVPPPFAITVANRSEVSQRADILGQHARIDLETVSFLAGKQIAAQSGMGHQCQENAKAAGSNFQKVLAAYPGQVEASRLLTQANQFLDR